MKNIGLITNSYSNLKTELLEGGFLVDDYSLSSLDKSKNDLSSKKYSHILYELTPDSATSIRHIPIKPENIISIGKKFDKLTNNEMLKNGVTRFITQDNFQYIKPLLQYSSCKASCLGTILLFEENNFLKRIFKNIITHFNFNLKLAQSNEELYSNIKNNNIDLIIINLSNSGLKINEIIHEVYNDYNLRQIPIIIYKDMNEGLFIHELIAGINRLTKYILSIDETLHFLIDMLYKKNLIPLITKLNKKTDINTNYFYSEKSLKQIANQHTCDIFADTTISDLNPCDIISLNQDIQYITTIFNSYKWLINNK